MDIDDTGEGRFNRELLPVILDGAFFQVSSIDADGKNVVAKCQLCPKPKSINGSVNSTGNYLSHMKVIN